MSFLVGSPLLILIIGEKEDDLSISEISKGLTWKPWCPAGYQGFIILGESNYGGWENDEWLQSPDFVRNRILGPAMNGDPKEPLYRNLERALFGKPQISREERENLWNKVGYINLIQRPMTSIEERPSRQDYKNGWEHVWPELEALNCQKLLVVGTEPDKIQTFRQYAEQQRFILNNEIWSEKKNGSSYEISITISGSCVKRILFIKHASQFFSWEACAEFLKTCNFHYTAISSRK